MGRRSHQAASCRAEEMALAWATVEIPHAIALVNTGHTIRSIHPGPGGASSLHTRPD